MYRRFFKRTIDFLLALTLLIVLMPLMLFVMIYLYFANEGAGSFFTQERPGKNERIFKIIKFKTMTDELGEDGELLPDEQRLTKVGRLVRKTSIDELPQLINVLKGDMSFVGPRPLLIEFLPYYSSNHRRRHLVRPGITGLAQINGRNEQKYSMKFNFDVWYVDNHSFIVDMKILFLTIKKVVTSQDVGEGGANTAEVDDLGFDKKIRAKIK